ncbi:MAG: hypothetical protein HYY59_06280 [Candidatus Omnitrophica bacterium]|nr:hypothetical protein [Candidatus Omnitrophota bacterium]MBI2496090.1 hypothetical protein [Candidatus Omnitrophota bacterium]MBI3021584.1 hypothetical protein [Candidatus Omnitrophota bacterium]
MKKIWVRKAKSFREAERFDRQYYEMFSPNERVETVDWLRRIARKIGKIGKVGHGGTRLRRVIGVVQ